MEVCQVKTERGYRSSTALWGYEDLEAGKKLDRFGYKCSTLIVVCMVSEKLVVHWVANVIHWINCYLLDKVVWFS